MLDHNFTRIFEELVRFDVLEIYHDTGHYTIFERGIDLSPNEFLRVTAVCTRIIIAKMHKCIKVSLQLNFCTFAILTTKDCLIYFQSIAEEA